MRIRCVNAECDGAGVEIDWVFPLDDFEGSTPGDFPVSCGGCNETMEVVA